MALEEIDRDASRSAVLDAVKLAPDLVPAAALGRAAAGGSGRPAPRRKNSDRRLAAQSASGHRRGLCEFALRRHRAGAAQAHAGAGRQDCRASSKARWRWRAPRSTRANLPPRARRSHLISVGADQARRDADGRDRGNRARRRRPRARMDGPRHARVRRSGLDRRRRGVGPLAAGVAERQARRLSSGGCRSPRSA